MAGSGSGASPSLCPMCKKAVKPRAENAGFPFCSTRCQQAELGKWLNEEYRVPVEEDDEDPGGGDGSGGGFGGGIGSA